MELEYRNFYCDVDAEEYIQIDTSEINRNKSSSVYFETVNDNGIICLDREKAKELAEYILNRLKETE